MGSCFSARRHQDLSGNTFSHYSLTSQSENIDLYPGFRYVETEASLCEESQSVWRRSSVPLLNYSDDDHRHAEVVSQCSTISNCHTLCSEVIEDDKSENCDKDQKNVQKDKSETETKSIFSWSQSFHKLRSFGRSKKIFSDDRNVAKAANDNEACIRLSVEVGDAIEEDFL